MVIENVKHSTFGCRGTVRNIIGRVLYCHDKFRVFVKFNGVQEQEAKYVDRMLDHVSCVFLKHEHRWFFIFVYFISLMSLLLQNHLYEVAQNSM